jgi:hypothetical protein
MLFLKNSCPHGLRMEGDIAASATLVDPVLVLGVAEYEGLPRSQWITKSVLLKDDNGGSVAIGVCHNVCLKLVLGSEGPLGPSKVAVQIVDVLVVEERTSDWMFTLRGWNITHAFYDGASLYDHDTRRMACSSGLVECVLTVKCALEKKLCSFGTCF